MHIIPIAWLYVALMMAVVEASSPHGTLLGAFFTFVLYGVLPVGLLMYLLGTPLRWRVLKARERSASTPRSVTTPDAGGEAPADPVAPVREEA